MLHEILCLSPRALTVSPLESRERIYCVRMGDLHLGDAEAKIRSYLAGFFKLQVLTGICIKHKAEQDEVEWKIAQ